MVAKKKVKKVKKTPPTSDTPAPRNKAPEIKPEPKVEKKTVTATLVNDSSQAVTVANVSALEPKQALAQATSLYKSIEKSLVVWCATLHEIKEKGHYKEGGYKTYKDYVEDTFKISIRNAQDKVETYKALCLENNVKPSKLEKMGHSKGLVLKKALAKGTISAEDLPEKIETALGVSERELKSIIDGAKKGKPSEKKKGTQLEGDGGKQDAWEFSTRIVGKKGIELVHQAKEKMDTQEGKEVSQAVFLERLAMEYLASTIDKSNPIQHYCRLLQTAYPDRVIIAVHKKHADKFQEFAKSLQKEKAPGKEGLKKKGRDSNKQKVKKES